MTLQLISNKPFVFLLNNIKYEYVKPKYLIKENELKLIEAKVKGSTIIWYVDGEQLSYNQIKKLLIK